MLVGMLKNPALYNPNRRISQTESRRNVVLSQMRRYKFINQFTFDSLKVIPINLNFKRASHNEGLAPYLREYLREELKKWCASHKKADGSNYNLYTDGLKVHTTINSRLQTFAEQAMRVHMSSLQKDFYHQPLAKIIFWIKFYFVLENLLMQKKAKKSRFVIFTLISFKVLLRPIMTHWECAEVMRALLRLRILKLLSV